MKYCFCIIMILLPLRGFSQTPKEIEDHLVSVFSLYNDVAGSYYESRSDTSEESMYNAMECIDSMTDIEDSFIDLILDYANKYPNTLYYDFKDLQKEGVWVLSSPDKKFRIYRWYVLGGGTMHEERNIFQFESHGKVYAQWFGSAADDSDNSNYTDLSAYDSVYCLHFGNKQIYIASYVGIEFGSAFIAGFDFFGIQDSDLSKELPIVKSHWHTKSWLGMEFHPDDTYYNHNDSMPLTYCFDDGKTLLLRRIDRQGYLIPEYDVYQFKDGFYRKTNRRKFKWPSNIPKPKY